MIRATTSGTLCASILFAGMLIPLFSGVDPLRVTVERHHSHLRQQLCEDRQRSLMVRSLILHLHLTSTLLPSPSNMPQFFAYSSTPCIDVGRGGHMYLRSTSLYTVQLGSNRLTTCCKWVHCSRKPIGRYYWCIPCNYLWYLSMAGSFNKVAYE